MIKALASRWRNVVQYHDKDIQNIITIDVNRNKMEEYFWLLHKKLSQFNYVIIESMGKDSRDTREYIFSLMKSLNTLSEEFIEREDRVETLNGNGKTIDRALVRKPSWMYK